MSRGTIAVLMACHNRRATTVACLGSLHRAVAAAGPQVTASLIAVDDGSTDGTAGAVAQEWPGARVITASGTHFWAASMALAEQTALAEQQDLTHLLWLNDDVALDEVSIIALLETSSKGSGAIAVGALRGELGQLSYSGIRLLGGFDPLAFEPIEPSGKPQLADTLNGNVVLVPIAVARQLGGIDGGFEHSLADFDYGVRARAAGIPVLVTPDTVGACSRNIVSPPQTMRERWRFVFDRKGDALRDRWRYLRRHGRPAALLLLAVPPMRFAAGELSRVPVMGRLIPRRALPIHQR